MTPLHLYGESLLLEMGYPNLFLCRQMVELTQNVNSLGNQINDLSDENEELRERLGLDAKAKVDLTDFRTR